MILYCLINIYWETAKHQAHETLVKLDKYANIIIIDEEVTVSTPLEEEEHLQTILDTTKRKCSWPITKGIFKKRKLEGGHRKKENFDHQYTEMNFSKWWWRMEKEGQPGASGMESKKKSFSGKAKKPSPCDFKLAYISLW